MSNDGSATPEPGEQPSSTGRPAPAPEGQEPPAAPPSDAWPTAPYGTPPAAQPSAGEWPTAPYGTRAAGDQPTAAYGTPHADQPTSPYGVPPVTGGGYPAPGGDDAPATMSYGTPAAASGEQPGEAAPGGYPAPGGAYAAAGYPQPGQPAQPGQPQGGYPAYPGYPGQPGGNPPAGGGAYPYGGAPYGGSPAPTTDGVSIAALVTSLLGMNVVAVVLGVLGLRRTKKNGTQGRGLALAGLIIGAVELVALVVIGIAITVAVVSHGNQMSSLRDDCESGVMQACDDLYYGSDVGSDDEEFGRTCGDRTDGYASCAGIDAERFTYGDDEALDTLWDACGSGDGAACDELAATSSAGSEYEQFGLTCGGTTEAYGFCASGSAGADDSGDEGTAGGSYGDDPAFDALWDACEAGSGSACDDLYMDSPAGSEYEDFGLTCGNRVDFAVSCSDEIGD
jgi:hypothetical protein